MKNRRIISKGTVANHKRQTLSNIKILFGPYLLGNSFNYNYTK